MYITINDIIGEKRIDLSYPSYSSKEVAVIKVLSDNVQYEIPKPHMAHSDSPPVIGNLILNITYSGRELLSVVGGMAKLTKFVNDDRVIKMNKLERITELILNLDELDNTDNLEDGRPSSALVAYHVTADEDFTQLVTYTRQYKKLQNGEFTSLILRITDQNGSTITDGLQVTVVLHIRDCKL